MVDPSSPQSSPRQPARGKTAKTGLKEGTTPTRGPKSRGKRPVEEEDVYGGAERTHVTRVKSDKVKP